MNLMARKWVTFSMVCAMCCFFFFEDFNDNFFLFLGAFVWVVFYLLFPDGCWCPSGGSFISSSAPNGALLLLKNKSEIASFLRVRTKPAGGDLVNVAQGLKSSQLLLWKTKQVSDWRAPIRMDYPFCYCWRLWLIAMPERGCVYSIQKQMYDGLLDAPISLFWIEC